MSDMEHNKGKLIPINLDLENYDEDTLDELLHDNDWQLIDGEVYSVEWEVKRGELYGFGQAKQNEDGSIDFNTYHYNGGGHWTEVVENALENGSTWND